MNLALKPPSTVANPKEDQTTHRKSCQRLSDNGRIYVTKKAWILRITTLAGLILVMGYNLQEGLILGDPLVTYSTLMPLHAFAVFAVGWFFFRSQTNGKAGNDLVSIIVPIFNQESMIEIVIKAISRSTYKNIEIIAVNDGSRDGTKDILDRLNRSNPNLKVIHKKNEGKRKAVATGFYASKGKYIVLIDSDSVIDKHAIEEFMKTFGSNPEVGAVVGYAKVWNSDKNILTRCQDVWYDYAFNIHKTTESTFGSVLCCSGCLSAYRREAIADYIPYWIQARIYNSDDRDLTAYTFATPWAKKELAPLSQKMMESMARYDDSEDRGLTAHTLVEWKTVYVPSALVYTEVPDNLKGYFKQQTRWKKGYLRSNFFVSAFFWRKNPIMSLIFYTEFMSTFTAPIIMFIVYFYEPFILHNCWLTLAFLGGQLLIGLSAGIDYKLRDPKSTNWIYKPLMNLIASFVLSWLVFPALFTYRKNQWLTR